MINILYTYCVWYSSLGESSSQPHSGVAFHAFINPLDNSLSNEQNSTTFSQFIPHLLIPERTFPHGQENSAVTDTDQYSRVKKIANVCRWKCNETDYLVFDFLYYTSPDPVNSCFPSGSPCGCHHRWAFPPISHSYNNTFVHQDHAFRTPKSVHDRLCHEWQGHQLSLTEVRYATWNAVTTAVLLLMLMLSFPQYQPL